MMQGRRHWRPLHGKARAMACGGNPRALPDLRACLRSIQREVSEKLPQREAACGSQVSYRSCIVMS